MDLTNAAWRKSSRSGNNGGACVEIADLHAVIAVRDSKDPDGHRLSFTRETWAAFATLVKDGRLNL